MNCNANFYGVAYGMSKRHIVSVLGDTAFAVVITAISGLKTERRHFFIWDAYLHEYYAYMFPWNRFWCVPDSKTQVAVCSVLRTFKKNLSLLLDKQISLRLATLLGATSLGTNE